MKKIDWGIACILFALIYFLIRPIIRFAWGVFSVPPITGGMDYRVYNLIESLDYILSFPISVILASILTYPLFKLASKGTEKKKKLILGGLLILTLVPIRFGVSQELITIE